MAKTQYFDHAGNAITLGSKIAAGGEGEILEIAGDTTRVAKLLPG